MLTAITTIAAFVFFFLYICKSQDCTSLERDNKWLKEQREQAPEPVVVDNPNNRPLDKESAMEAIRYNGYIPETEGHWITFMAQGEHYVIDTDRFPVMTLMKHFNLDPKDWDMGLMHKAAHQVSDDIIMGKVLFTGDEEDGIIFQITAIENKYGHFKDCLTQYISIIDESQARMDQTYNDLEAKRKERLSAFPQMVAGAAGDKKVMS